MKIFKYSFILGLLLTITNCSPDNEGEYGSLVNREAQITGSWAIQSVSQIDLEAEKKSFPEFATKLDITNAVAEMPYSDFIIDIQSGSVTTTIGNSPMSLIIAEGSGSWSWISDSEIDLVNNVLGINASSGITTTINGQNVDLFIASYSGITGENPILSINYERTDSTGNAVMRYEYILAKQ